MREQLYHTMRRIRRFEETVVELVNANEIAGVTHEYIGQEAVATGVCAALRRDDVVTSTHRGHGHCLAKGADLSGMFAELLGRTTGLNRGRGGSMHVADLGVGILGANGIVAAGAPIATGAAWAARAGGRDTVAVAFFGDGACNQGVLHESMNLAALWSLPVLFVCENNGYAVTMASETASAGSLVGRAAAYGIAAHVVDGMDADAVLAAVSPLVAAARAGAGPAFIEARTYRFVGHHTAERTMGLRYREDEEIERWRVRDPLAVVGQRIAPERRSAIDEEVEIELATALDAARAGALPDAADVLEHVYADGPLPRAGVAA